MSNLPTMREMIGKLRDLADERKIGSPLIYRCADDLESLYSQLAVLSAEWRRDGRDGLLVSHARRVCSERLDLKLGPAKESHDE